MSAVAPAAHPLHRGGVRLTARAGLLAAVVVVLLIASVVPIRRYAHERARVERLEQEAVQLETANRELAERIERLRDPAVLERLARECLGMVEPGEIAFVAVPEAGAPSRPDC